MVVASLRRRLHTEHHAGGSPRGGPLASPELCRLLVADKGWAIDRYETWLLDTLTVQLLVEAPTPEVP